MPALLDTCTTFCAALSSTIGPTLTEIVLGGAGLALVWWRGRKHVAAVLAPVVQRADLAEQKAAAAHVQLAELRGSLRPLALASPPPPAYTPTLGTSSSSSGNYEPIVMPELDAGTPRPRPSMPRPELTGDAPFPSPPPVPGSYDGDESATTRPERPSAKRGT